jgi:hypothetical protein
MEGDILDTDPSVNFEDYRKKYIITKYRRIWPNSMRLETDREFMRRISNQFPSTKFRIINMETIPLSKDRYMDFVSPGINQNQVIRVWFQELPL